MDIIESRIEYSRDRLDEFRRSLKEARRLVGRNACVYAIGSYGRWEAGRFSDLDLYIVSNLRSHRPALRPLDEICLKADLISAARKLEFPDFDGEGRYLVSYPINKFLDTLGKPEDDAENTFTARLLLLLESTAVVGESFRNQAIKKVIDAYWRDYSDHKMGFSPPS